MPTYSSKQRIIFGILAVLFALVVGVAIIQLRTTTDEDEGIGLLLAALASGAVALVVVKIVVTGRSWPRFEQAGGASMLYRLAGWGLLILLSVALVWYAGRHR